MKRASFEELKPAGFAEKLSKVKLEIENHPAIKELRFQYPDKPFSLSELREYARSHDNCNKCQGLEHCQNNNFGHRMKPFVLDDSKYLPTFDYEPCHLLKHRELQNKIKRMVRSHNVPEHILNSTFATLETDAGNKLAIVKAMKFCAEYEKDKTKRGLYIHGPLGVGKSSICGAISQELGKRGIDVIFVYWPDFLIEVKSAIKTGEVEQKIEHMRKVSVLIIDDIGAESLSAWTRDEILGPVIQARMERLATVYTSNLTLSELEEHLAQAKEERKPNHMKAARLMERIEPFVETIEVQGRNRRRDKNVQSM